MQQWFAIFGIVGNWMSDQGPHYKNAVMQESSNASMVLVIVSLQHIVHGRMGPLK